MFFGLEEEGDEQEAKIGLLLHCRRLKKRDGFYFNFVPF